MALLLEEFEWFSRRATVQLPPKKVFIQKHKEIPLLLDYSGKAPASWWQHWPKLSWEESRQEKSTIDPRKMIAWAMRANHPYMGTVLDVA